MWLFAASGDLRALCRDELGADLPEQLGPWRLIKVVDLVGVEADEAEAVRLVARHGVCCFSAAPP